MHLRRDISEIEFLIYIIAWGTCVIFSIYCFAANTSKRFQNYEDLYLDFNEGWSFVSRKKDNGDGEWRIITFLLKTFSLWVISSSMVSELLRQFKLFHLLQLWQILISVACILSEFGIIALGLIIFQPLLFALVLKFTRNKFAIWFVNIFALLLLFVYKGVGLGDEFILEHALNQQSAYLVVTTVYWMNLKCLAYSIDCTDLKEEHAFLNFASYCLYLPSLVCGPFVSYKNFEGYYRFNANFGKRFLKLVLNIFRFLFWFIFTEFFLHFIYVNAVAYHPMWIKSFDSWSLYGYGYTMGQFFHIKYVIIYGLATTFQEFENIQVPSLPICIGRVHLYSDMWKYFDAGLYNFLLRYMYIPLMKNFLNNRLIASLMCFIFIYIWHGTEYYIFMWSALNYIGIIIEHLSKWIHDKYLQNSALQITVGHKWYRRITCAAASPLLAMSAISNFYFFAGDKIGYIFLSKLLSYDNIWPNMILLMILYTMCQVSTEIRSKENTSRKQKAT